MLHKSDDVKTIVLILYQPYIIRQLVWCVSYKTYDRLNWNGTPNRMANCELEQKTSKKKNSTSCQIKCVYAFVHSSSKNEEFSWRSNETTFVKETMHLLSICRRLRFCVKDTHKQRCCYRRISPDMSFAWTRGKKRDRSIEGVQWMKQIQTDENQHVNLSNVSFYDCETIESNCKFDWKKNWFCIWVSGVRFILISMNFSIGNRVWVTIRQQKLLNMDSMNKEQ